MNYMLAIPQAVLDAMPHEAYSAAMSVYAACVKGNGIKRMTRGYYDADGNEWAVDCIWPEQLAVTPEQFNQICGGWQQLIPALKYCAENSPLDVLEMWGLRLDATHE